MSEEAEYDIKKININGLTVREKKELYQKLTKALFNSEESKKPGAEENILSIDRLYANIDEASQNCRKTFFIYIALLSYALLTILTTSDMHLILGQNINLPVIDTNVPVHFFFIITPFLAIGLFVYIQLYLIKIDKLIKYSLKKCHDKYGNNCLEEPKCKKDEKRFDIHGICNLQKNYLYPWIIIFSRYYEKGLVGALQRMIVKYSLWWFLPIVLMSFNLFVIRKHEPVTSYYLLFITLVGTTIVLAFWHYLDKSKYFGKIGLCLIGIIFLYFTKDFIPAANLGILGADKDSLAKTADTRPKYLEYFSNWANIDLEHEILINEPEGVQKYKTIPLVNLKGAHLEGANLASTILIRANLRNASLQYANLDKAILDGADLDRANLNFAKLTEANLKNASLYRAQLRESDLASAKLMKAGLSNSDLLNADLQGANLQDADLQCSNLRGAKFGYSNLFGAKFHKADLLFADLREAKGIKIEQIQSAMNWKLAFYSKALIYGLHLMQDHNNRIKNLNFSDFNLVGANLQSADLRGANLQGALLKEANLQGADLRNITGITEEQLYTATNYKLAIFDKDLLEILNLPADHNVRLKKRNFSNYDMKGADLSEADLKEATLRNADLRAANLQGANLHAADLSRADLRKAVLKGANFQNADLSGILFSNYDQFADVNTLYQAKLDKNLMNQLKDDYPFLFEKPIRSR